MISNGLLLTAVEVLLGAKIEKMISKAVGKALFLVLVRLGAVQLRIPYVS